MVKVQVRPDTLEEIASSFARAKEDSEKRIQDLTLTIFNLQMQWFGTSQQRFYSDFFEAKKHMESYIKHLSFTELELRRIAKKFREADEKAYGEYNPVDKMWEAFQRGGARAAEDTIFDPLQKAWKQTSDFFGNLVDDPKGTLEDAKDRIMDSIDDKKEEFKDKYEFSKDLLNDPIGTLKHEWAKEIQKMYDMRNALSDWYVRNIQYGDLESGTELVAYGVTSFAFLAVGTKGAGALSNGVRWGRDLSRMSSYEMRGGLSTVYGGNSYVRRFDTNSPARDTFQFSIGETARDYSHLKNLDNFKIGTKEDALKHIFYGEVTKKGKAVGFHYEGMEGSKGKIVGEIEGPNNLGVYRANVEIDGEKKNGKSTFFPKSMTEQQIIDCINEAYENKELVQGRFYTGTASNGMTIEMQINGKGQITSAYPIL
ncbi:WXG100 family type VII secretion target [Bacillus cereus group sp. BfR-BA-01380]|uniref:WXG100 family type VII secretion target n=1 Tax=Bacillus cereus group sp. BfR-BA-01380 TaxID=2920324 RepID=UPI001F569A37|nr:WXG100 family type VII secretion target [Bacillus cereus group sp. BfR-BA-01380]